MRYRKGMLAGAMLALLPLLASTAANAQKQGGTLRIFHRDSPANMSIHEEGTISVVAPIMPIFNNLVLFNQHEKQNRLDNIVPDLAESWSWSEDGMDLTFKLHQGLNWHDGKAVYRRRHQVHLGPAAGQGEGKAAPQCPRSMVGQSRQRHRRKRPSGDISSEAAAAGLSRLSRLRFLTGLSVPRLAGADAAAPDRHGAIQIR